MALSVLFILKVPDWFRDELILKSTICMIVIVTPAAELLAAAARTMDKGRPAL
jgi:hypothetical protein